MEMKSLKDKKLTTSEYGVVYCEEYVKEAVSELLLRQEIKPVKDFNRNSVSMRYIKVKDFIEIVGDFEDEK